jgi:general stress protein 26
MPDQPSNEDLTDRLWSEIGKGRFGMLGLVGHEAGGHFQPMTAFAEPEAAAIYFFTRKSTDLARAVEGGDAAMFIVQAKDQEFQACIGGRLAHDHDRIRIQHYWNPVVAAWYPEGKDDPDLTLLRLDVHDAQVWISKGNPLVFSIEIARARITGQEPEVGQSSHLDLR